MLSLSLLFLALQAQSQATEDPGPTWLFPAIPQIRAVWRPDLGLPGVASPARPEFDLGTQEAAKTVLGVTTWSDKVRVGGLSLDEGHSAFWTKTVVSVPGGGVLGFDAYDLREGLNSQNPTGALKTWDSPAGIRFGGGWDLLYPFVHDHWISWGLEGWVPAWSDGETVLRTGLRLGSIARFDGGVAWRRLDVAGRLDSGDGLWDTLNNGGLACTWDFRAAGNLGDAQWQTWGGYRTIDPRGDSTLWRQFERTIFSGASLRLPILGTATTAELRGEEGRERASVHCDTDGLDSHLEHMLWSTRLQVEPWEPGALGLPRVWLEYAWLRLNETSLTVPVGNWLPGFAGTQAAGRSVVTRLGVNGSWTVFWRSFSLAPQLGWNHIERSGTLPKAWTAGLGDAEVLAGASQANVWTTGIQVAWNFSGSRWSYRLTRPWSEASGLTPGFRHEMLLSQTF